MYGMTPDILCREKLCPFNSAVLNCKTKLINSISIAGTLFC